MEKTRESWGSRFGFIMATAGFAIGLGAIWRFPYMVGVNGGGAFLIVYILLSAVIGIPLFIAEVTLGRKTQKGPILGMRDLTKKGSPWRVIGWLGGIASLMIMSYYVVILGWMVAYLVKMITGEFVGASTVQIQAIYSSFTSNMPQVVFYTILVTILLGIIVTRGLKDGIEKYCKVLMPALFVLLIVLAVKSLLLPGAMEGVKWYLTPDFSKINGQVILAALGQAFFAIGIGVATAFIYGSYLERGKSSIPSDSSIIVLANTMIAIVAGLIIFPAIFSLGLSPDSGPGLVFVTMPNLFAQMTGGRIFGIMFFFLVVIAGLTSGMGYLEAVAVCISEIFNIDRKKSTLVALGTILLMSILPILSYGPLKDVLIGGRNFFDLADFLSGNVLMPVGALIISLYTAFVWKFKNYKEEANLGCGKFRIYNWWKPVVVFVIPVAVAVIMVTGLI